MAFDRNAWRKEWREKHPDKVQEQLERDNARRRLARENEVPEQREKRLAKHRARHKKWRDNNPEKLKAYVAKDRAKNMDRIRLQSRARAIEVKYGITIEKYFDMIEKQGGRCAICGSDKATTKHSKFNWRVDHCHTTGKVRKLLCHNCNVALGLVKEDTDTLKKMIDYINHHNPKR